MQPQDLPQENLDENFKLTERTSKMTITQTVYLRIYTSKTLLDIANKRAVKNYLCQNRAWLKSEEFGARPAATIGFLVHVHPKYARYESTIQSMKTYMESIQADEAEKATWMKNNPDLGGEGLMKKNPVPKFTLFSAKRSYNRDGDRVTTEVLNVRCATEDRRWLAHLLIRISTQADQTDVKGMKFIPQNSLQYTSYVSQINCQISYLESCYNIPILGISGQAEKSLVPFDKGQIPLGEYILHMTNALSLEPTNRTWDLGKHFLIVNKRNADRAKHFLDRVLPSFYSKNIRDDLLLPDFPFPRRPNQPLLCSREDQEYMDGLQRGTPPKQQGNSVNPWNTTREVIPIDDEVGPQAKVRRRSQFESPTSSGKHDKQDLGIQSLITRMSILEGKLNSHADQNIDEQIQSRLQGMEEKQAAYFDDLEKRMESELTEIRESNRVALESSQKLFMNQITKSRQDFGADLLNQTNTFQLQLKQQSDAISERFDMQGNVINKSIEANRMQLLSDITSLLRGKPEPNSLHSQDQSNLRQSTNLLTPESHSEDITMNALEPNNSTIMPVTPTTHGAMASPVGRTLSKPTDLQPAYQANAMISETLLADEIMEDTYQNTNIRNSEDLYHEARPAHG